MRKDWIKIKNYYLTHEISLEELSKKYKVSISTLTKRSAKEKWSELKADKRKEIEAKAEEKITNQVIDEKVRANKRHNELYTMCLDVAEKILNKYMAELESGKKKKISATAYNLSFVTKSISDAQKGQRLSLKIDDSEDLANKEPEVFVIKGLDLDKI
jgi:glutathionylspermidine synthase